MQKVKTVKRIGFIAMIVLTLISCQKEQQNDDQVLLELVLRQKQSEFSKPIYLNPNGDSGTVSDFFRLRMTKKRTFTIEYDSISANDTLTPRKGKMVYKDEKITNNNYLMNGQGIDENVEIFLKDSFNYKQERIVKWIVPKSLKNIVNQNQDTKDYLINVSAPVYNLSKNKAIVKTFHRSSKNMARQNIYFIERKAENWTIIYSEKGDMFLDLRIE